MAIMESQGAILYFSTTPALSTAIVVGNIQGFSGPTGSAAVIDVSNLGSTAKEKMMGLPDEGNISFDLQLNTTDSGQIKMRECRAARTKGHWAIKMTDSSVTAIHGDGYVTGFSITGGVDNIIKASAQIEITGPVVWTTLAP
jgi:hypothetical protein